MYNFTANRIASEVRDRLAQQVTDVLRGAPKEEHAQIQLAGQVAHVILQDVDDETLVEMQIHGSFTPSAGARTFFISLTARAIRTKSTEDNTPMAVWSPDQGPLALKDGVGTTTSG